MTDSDRQSLHRFLLIGARAAGELGRNARQFTADVRADLGRELSEEQVTSELRQLADQRYLAPITRALIGVRWTITTRGEQALAEAGL